MIGFLLIDKPAGLTSHAIVNRLRRCTGQKRIGHSGTLDPQATGLLILGVGGATRLIEYLSDLDKEYTCTGRFGFFSSTDDAEGELIPHEGARPIDQAELEAVLPEFSGEIWQIPPKYSAIKVQGQKMYELARRGQEIEIPQRMTTVHHIRCSSFEYPYFDLRMRVSTGTYVRAIVRDIGERLNQGAYVTQMRRTSIGQYTVDQALTLADIEAREGIIEISLIPPAEMLNHLPLVVLDPVQIPRILHGNGIVVSDRQMKSANRKSPGTVLLLDQNRQALAIGKSSWTSQTGHMLSIQPKKVFQQLSGKR